MPDPTTKNLLSVSGDFELDRKDLSKVNNELDVHFDTELIVDVENEDDLARLIEMSLDNNKDLFLDEIDDPESSVTTDDVYYSLAKKINKEASLPYKVAVFESGGSKDVGPMVPVDKENPLSLVRSGDRELYYQNFTDGTKRRVTKDEFENLKAQKKNGSMVMDVPMNSIIKTPENTTRRTNTLAEYKELKAKAGLSAQNKAFVKDTFKRSLKQ